MSHDGGGREQWDPEGGWNPDFGEAGAWGMGRSRARPRRLSGPCPSEVPAGAAQEAAGHGGPIHHQVCAHGHLHRGESSPLPAGGAGRSPGRGLQEVMASTALGSRPGLPPCGGDAGDHPLSGRSCCCPSPSSSSPPSALSPPTRPKAQGTSLPCEVSACPPPLPGAPGPWETCAPASRGRGPGRGPQDSAPCGVPPESPNSAQSSPGRCTTMPRPGWPRTTIWPPRPQAPGRTLLCPTKGPRAAFGRTGASWTCWHWAGQQRSWTTRPWFWATRPRSWARPPCWTGWHLSRCSAQDARGWRQRGRSCEIPSVPPSPCPGHLGVPKWTAGPDGHAQTHSSLQGQTGAGLGVAAVPQAQGWPPAVTCAWVPLGLPAHWAEEAVQPQGPWTSEWPQPATTPFLRLCDR